MERIFHVSVIVVGKSNQLKKRLSTPKKRFFDCLLSIIIQIINIFLCKSLGEGFFFNNIFTFNGPFLPRLLDNYLYIYTSRQEYEDPVQEAVTHFV